MRTNPRGLQRYCQALAKMLFLRSNGIGVVQTLLIVSNFIEATIAPVEIPILASCRSGSP
jgi:hypothetical protein